MNTNTDRPCKGINFRRFLKYQVKEYQRNGFDFRPIARNLRLCGFFVRGINELNGILWPPSWFKQPHSRFNRLAQRIGKAAVRQNKLITLYGFWYRTNTPGYDARQEPFRNVYKVEYNTLERVVVADTEAKAAVAPICDTIAERSVRTSGHPILMNFSEVDAITLH